MLLVHLTTLLFVQPIQAIAVADLTRPPNRTCLTLSETNNSTLWLHGA